jgi:DNA-directed RNA polymerase specialized sigma24 family protein
VETWTAAQCAEAWGVRPGTWAAYVSRGQAPAPLPGTEPKHWSAAEVRDFPRPGAGRSRAGAGAEAQELLAEMTTVSERIEELRSEQRRLLVEGKERGLEISPMAKALGISRQTAYSWLS